jgi:ribosome-binding factor A
MTRRTDRVNGLLRQEISYLISHELRDPRLSGVVSITQVETSSDLRHAKVFVSVLGEKEQKDKVLRGINSAMGFVRKELKGRLSLRYVPELQFALDETLDEAEHIFRLMNSLQTFPDEPPPAQGSIRETSEG